MRKTNSLPISLWAYLVCFRKDLSLVEVNPLVLTQQGNLVCLDAKIAVDDNALFRHKDLSALQDLTQNDAREAEAEKFQLNYVALGAILVVW